MFPNIQLYGSMNPLPEPVSLRAGRISMYYDSGFLRYIKIGETEILRMINYYIRDENWNTIPMTITSEKVDVAGRSFHIAYTAACVQGDIAFEWKCQIHGNDESTITFEIEGEATRTFKRNRLGFTVLHPLDPCLGKECTLIHPDNSKSVVPFPVDISPHQPFLNLAGMLWQPAEGVTATVHFEGDVFESEDQRNWTDASFKTYCTPLSKPFPVTVKQGEKIRQKINLQVSGGDDAGNPDHNDLTFSIHENNTRPFPAIGIPLSSLFHNPSTWKRIQEVGIDFLRVTFVAGGPSVSRDIETIPDTTIPLELVLFFQKEAIPGFIKQLKLIRNPIKQIIVLPAYDKSTDANLINRVIGPLRETFPGASIGGGTDEFFTELNRHRTPATELDFLSFSVNPQVHAVDIATMTENLQTMSQVVDSCRKFSNGKGIHVGPVTFKMRKNPNATSTSVVPAGTLPDGVDPRQLSLYGAGWTLGCFKYLAESGPEAITFFETCGWKGIIPHPDQPWPAEFQFPDEGVYPLFLILREILSRKGNRIVTLSSNRPLIFDGLAFQNELGQYTVMLANYSPRERQIVLPADLVVTQVGRLEDANISERIVDMERVSMRPLDASKKVVLPPFGITILS